MKHWMTALPVLAALLLIAPEALAQSGGGGSEGWIGLGAGLAIGLAAIGGALGQGNAAKGALESIARNPQAASQLNVPLFASLAFIESLVIFSFVIAFSLQGKL